jgi:5-methylcytosine-specific restriction endonuclease McrA
MSYLKTINNSDKNYPNETIVACDICNENFPTQYPHYYIKKKDVHICYECIEHLSEWFVSNHVGSPGLLWLKSMEQKYYNKYKKTRSCYLPKKIRQKILQKYKFTCQKCGSKEKLTIDHIKPISKGGTDDFNNLTILCKSCNSRKGAKYEN